jgi:hypothetical protein
MKNIRFDLDQVKDKSILDYYPPDIDKVEADVDGVEWLITKGEENKWNVEKPVKKEKIENWPVSSFLWDMKETEYISLVPTGSEDAPKGDAAKPRITVKLYKMGAQAPVILALSWADPVKAGADPSPPAGETPPPAEKAEKPEKELQTPSAPVFASVTPSEPENTIFQVDTKTVTKLRDGFARLIEKEASQ